MRPFPLKHIQRGVELLDLLARYGGSLTNSQVSDLLFADQPNADGQPRTEGAARQAANRSLRRLWHSGFVDRQRVVLTSRRTQEPYIAFVNVLEDAGVEALREYYATLDPANTPPELKAGPELRPQQLEHAVAINDVLALATRACRQRSVPFGSWRNDRQLAAANRQRQTHFVSLPDAFFALKLGEVVTGQFLELDRGTESVIGISDRRRDWRGKIEGYERYFRELYDREALFEGIAAPVVLAVTTSPERLSNLMEATRAAGGSGRYWYATLDELDPDDETLPRGANFWAPIWRSHLDATPRSLLALPRLMR